MPNRANPNPIPVARVARDAASARSPVRPRRPRRPALLTAALLAALIGAPAAWSQTPKEGEGTSRRQAPATSKSATKPAAKPAAPAHPAPDPSKPVPEACRDLRGIQQLTCVECDGLMPHRRLVCEQKLFWSHCGKGMRLFKDSWCGDSSSTPR